MLKSMEDSEETHVNLLINPNLAPGAMIWRSWSCNQPVSTMAQPQSITDISSKVFCFRDQMLPWELPPCKETEFELSPLFELLISSCEVCKDQQRELHKCWDQAQEWEGREELTLLLGSCLGNTARAGQQSLAGVTEGSWMWREKASQEHGRNSALIMVEHSLSASEHLLSPNHAASGPLLPPRAGPISSTTAASLAFNPTWERLVAEPPHLPAAGKQGKSQEGRCNPGIETFSGFGGSTTHQKRSLRSVPASICLCWKENVPPHVLHLQHQSHEKGWHISLCMLLTPALAVAMLRGSSDLQRSSSWQAAAAALQRTAGQALATRPEITICRKEQPMGGKDRTEGIWSPFNLSHKMSHLQA
ncbi:hypothetical protein DV515_00003555, partial [Chloebia gouldiae]